VSDVFQNTPRSHSDIAEELAFADDPISDLVNGAQNTTHFRCRPLNRTSSHSMGS